jgi:hypothetical protein
MKNYVNNYSTHMSTCYVQLIESTSQLEPSKLFNVCRNRGTIPQILSFGPVQ